ncbi:MAG: DNA polymerase III subunit beta [Chloroflexi bacterium]|nr:DNA polymerase III subunit beta [Chloroflexota bacterium]
MHLEKGQLSLASADGYRATVERLPVDYAGEKEDLTLPGDAVKKLLRGHKDAEVGITLPSERNSVTFTLPNIAVSSQLLEGRFPDYASIIPRSYVTKAIFYANDMRIALQRAEVFAKDNANSCTLSITPAFNPGEPTLLTLSAKSPEQGQTEAMLDATAEGEKTAWSANYKFMLEAVESYRKDSERLVIHTNGPENPAIIRPEYYPERDGEVNAHNAGSITVIMPMAK